MNIQKGFIFLEEKYFYEVATKPVLSVKHINLNVELYKWHFKVLEWLQQHLINYNQ